MLKWRPIIMVLCLGVFLIPDLALAASFDYIFIASRDGHVKIWRTYNGVRISSDPAIDSDVKKGEQIVVSGQTEWVNDCDVKWDDADGLKNCNFVAHSYGYDRFEDFLADHPGALEHYAFIDIGETEISVDVELATWYDFLQINPIPDPAVLYTFANGTCPDLPGYTAYETVSGLAYNGTCEVIGTCTLSLRSQSVPALSGWMLAVMALGLLVVTAVFLSRRKSAGSC